MNTLSLLNAGTLAYMSPERLEGPEGAPASEASDWYSVGAMLYEALVGTLPFGAETQVGLYKAQKRPPIPPHKLNEKIPTDLSELSLALLHRDPKARAGAAEVAALASSATNTDEPGPSAASLDYGREAFVGRAAEEKRLWQAFDQSCNHNVLVLVEGVSGVGKTTLIEHFASAAYDSRKALVLRSRCHFQESVAYNGIDGIVDNLSRYLVLQSPEDLATRRLRISTRSSRSFRSSVACRSRPASACSPCQRIRKWSWPVRGRPCVIFSPKSRRSGL